MLKNTTLNAKDEIRKRVDRKRKTPSLDFIVFIFCIIQMEKAMK